MAGLALSSHLLALLLCAPAAPLPHDSLKEDLAAIRQRVATSPKPAPLHLQIADLERRLGRLDQARQALKLAELSGAPALEVQGQLAACALAGGELEEAEYLLTGILRGALPGVQPGALPGSLAAPRWYRRRAEVRLKAKHYLGAAEDLEAARKLAPHGFSPDDELLLADALASAGQLEASVASLDRALRPDVPTKKRRSTPASTQQNAVLIQRAIELQTQRGEFQSALDRTAALLSVGGAPHMVAELRGDLHLKLGRTERARAEWQTAAAGLRRVLRKRRRSPALRRALTEIEQKLTRHTGRGAEGGPIRNQRSQ